MKTLITRSNRVEVVDALRGFAIMIIFIIHVQEHFNVFNFPSPDIQPYWLNSIDTSIFRLTFSMFAGKSYSIFALLFGFTFFIQMRNEERKGKDFGYRFLWRMLILFCFGMVDSLFFPAGDILFIYAIVGISLFLVRKWSNKAILITAIILLAQPMEWIHYFISIFNPEYNLPNFRMGELFGEVQSAAMSGDTNLFFSTNITTGILANLSWTISVGRLLQTAGLFMIGFLIGRKELFNSSEKNINFWIYALVAAALLYNPLLELKGIMESNSEATPTTPIIAGKLAIVFDMWQKLAFTFVIVSSFVLLYQKDCFKRLTSNLRYFGQMTLTNYMLQSIVGAFLFLSIGLNMGPMWGHTVSFIISLVLVYIQILFSKWWMMNHRQGPLETIWHKLTWINSDRI